MATYEFKSLEDMADWFDRQDKLACAASERATTQRDKGLNMREATTYRSVAHMIRNSEIKAPCPQGGVCTNPQLCKELGKCSGDVALGTPIRREYQTSTLGTVTVPFDAKKLADNHESLLIIARNAYKPGEPWDRTKCDYVAAVKAIRNATGLGLKEAKDWCDANREQFK